MTEPKKRGGQPKPDNVRKRNSLTFRSRDAMRHQLQAHADANQRSLSEEIEYRLQRSLDQEQVVSGLADALLARISQMEDHLRTVQWMEGFRGTAQ